MNLDLNEFDTDDCCDYDDEAVLKHVRSCRKAENDEYCKICEEY